MDYDTDDIDFGKAVAFMGVIEKVTTVCPMNVHLMGAAMDRLKEMEDTLKERRVEAAKQRLKAEQEEAARLNAEALDKAAEQSRIDAENEANRQIASGRTLKPISVKPGEPNELDETKKRLAAQESETVTPRRI